MRVEIRNPNYQGPFGNTLLHGAVLVGDRREVQRLLAAGANPKLANRDGQTPLQVAVLLGHSRLYDLLAPGSADHLEGLLDQALEATFPASDPVAVTPGSRTPR
ncbi:MAG TPA: ankyrin repeat domain-containing protein [Burkholderiales bacterium]|nr:ankyrin repeat domain-containing protein [Burkholderiales bacterium]